MDKDRVKAVLKEFLVSDIDSILEVLFPRIVYLNVTVSDDQFHVSVFDFPDKSDCDFRVEVLGVPSEISHIKIIYHYLWLITQRINAKDGAISICSETIKWRDLL